MKRFIMMMTLVVVIVLFVPHALASVDTQTEFISNDGYHYTLMKDGSARIVGYEGKNEASVNLPSDLDRHHITAIASYAFEDCEFDTFTISEFVNTIDANAFDGCKNLEKITIPNNVLHIGGNPFTGCTALLNINVRPDHPTLATTTEFVLYTKRTNQLICYPIANTESSAVLPKQITYIAQDAFKDCVNLNTIILPDMVTIIDEGAFSGCRNLKQISIPMGVKSIGAAAFMDCSSLRQITLPDALTEIEISLFDGCSSLSGVNFPENVGKIGKNAFRGCKSVERISIGDSVISIGDYAFRNCSALIEASIAENVMNIGEGVFEGCNARFRMNVKRDSYAEIYATFNDITYRY